MIGTERGALVESAGDTNFAVTLISKSAEISNKRNCMTENRGNRQLM